MQAGSKKNRARVKSSLSGGKERQVRKKKVCECNRGMFYYTKRTSREFVLIIFGLWSHCSFPLLGMVAPCSSGLPWDDSLWAVLQWSPNSQPSSFLSPCFIFFTTFSSTWNGFSYCLFSEWPWRMGSRLTPFSTAIREYPRLDGLERKEVYLCSRFWKCQSMLLTPTQLFLVEGQARARQKEKRGWISTIAHSCEKNSNPLLRALLSSSKCLLKVSPPLNNILLGTKTQHDFWWGQIIFKL